MHSEIEKLAKLITEHSVAVKKGDRVLIDGDPTGTAQLHLELHKEILEKGGIPFHKLMLGEYDYLNLSYGKEHQFQAFAEDDKKWMEIVDILIGIQASMNPRRADRIDRRRLIALNKATETVRKLVYERFNAGKLKLFFVEYPTTGMAQEWGMSLMEYENHFRKACFLDKEDPIEEWKRLSEKQKRFIRYLEKKETIDVKGERTDLTFSIKGKKWTSDNGERYLPDGEIFTDYPVRDVVNGNITFTYPGIFARKEIKDLRLEFSDGKIVKAESSTEEELLHRMFEVEKESVYMSAFGIGTNYGISSFIGHMAFDEKMGGTIHLAFRGSPMWTMWVVLKHMGKDDKIYADNELFYENGNFII